MLPSIIILLIFNISFAQKSETELLKNYEFYVEKNIELGKWSTKFYLTNGLVSVQENYWKNELRSRTEFKRDRFGNVGRKITTFGSNEEKVNDVSNLKLEYKDSILIGRTFSNSYEKYSNFTELGKPKLIEEKIFVLLKEYSREQIEYDERGNITKSKKHTDFKDCDITPKPENEICIIRYKYDNRDNVIEISTEFEPKQKFPFELYGGIFIYEHEYYRYKYNKEGLWTKKYKTVNGKENLVAKRKYK